MSVSFKLTATGPLHEKPDRYVKFAVTRSLKEASVIGKEWIQQATPVKTGLLQSKWTARKVSWSEFEFKNEVPYAGYVEDQFKMMARNEDRIQARFEETLATEIVKALN